MSIASICKFAASIALVATAATAAAEVIDRVLAVVDREPILQSDIMDDISREQEYLAQTGGGTSAEQLMRAALEDAINNKILLREAQLNSTMYPGLVVTDADVEKELTRIRDNYGNSEQFIKDVEASGETITDIRERIRKRLMQIKMGRLKIIQFRDQIVISESDIAQYYQDNITQFQRPERVRLRQIFLEAGENASARATARARMEQIQAELANGADFQVLAKKYSQAIGAEDGGIIGWTNRGDLVPALDEAAFNLGEGQVSNIIETDGGFHILLAETREDAGLASLDEVRTEIEPILRDKQATAMYQSWITEERKRSRVQIFM